MTHTQLALLLAMTVAASAPAANATAVANQDKKSPIVGCAVKGTGDGDGFLLARDPDPATRARVLYWLDDDDDEVQAMMGQLVEITGDVGDDVKRGEIKVEREKDMVKLEINAAGRKATVKLAETPAAISAETSGKDRDEKLSYVVRKLDVKSAKIVAASCGG